MEDQTVNPTTVSLKYRDLISKSQEQIDQEQMDLNVQEAKSSVELTISKTKLSLAKAKKALSEIQSAVPYYIEEELKATQNVKELQDGLDFATNILTDRF